MKNAIAILFSLLCATTVIYSVQTTEPDTNYDITKLLNTSINRIFQSLDPDIVGELLGAIEHDNATEFQTEVAYDTSPFNNMLYFTGINISILDSDCTPIEYDFFNNKMVIKDAEFNIRLEGYAGPTKTESYAGFIRSMSFKNFAITVTQYSEDRTDNRFEIDISYDDVVYTYMYTPWFRETMYFYEQEELQEIIVKTLPSVLIYGIRNNNDFLQILNRTFCELESETEIELTHPDFYDHEEQYFYRAENVSSFHITLNNITINRLSNFHTFLYDYSYEPPQYTLVIRDVRGNANLCYDTDNATVFQIYFRTETVAIQVNKEKQRVFVKHQNYSMVETSRNASLSQRQSNWIMKGILQSIAASLMPSMNICRFEDEIYSGYKAVHPIVQLFSEISQKLGRNLLNESLDNWTPFEGGSTATKFAFYPESYNRTVSIHNMTIYSGMQNTYPYQIECHFFKMLQIIYDIDGSATGQVLLRNTTDETVKINFLAKFSLIDRIIKRKQNADFEFKLRLGFYGDSFNPFMIELSAGADYTLSDDEKSVVIKRINETLLSMIRNIMLRNAQPLLSIPSDFCTIPETPPNFLPPFGDYQAPYVIRQGAVQGGKYFTAKIYNVSLQGLSNFNLARVEFNKKFVSYFEYDDGREYCEAVGPFVKIPIYNITGRMSFNDSSTKFKELKLVNLTELLVTNATGEGRISVLAGIKYDIIPMPDDPGFSYDDSRWIMDRLESIIENSLMKNNTQIESVSVSKSESDSDTEYVSRY